MSDNLKDILNNLPPGVNQETIIRYLQGKLSAEEQHEVEKQMMGSDFEADALEGLQEIKDEKKLTSMLEQLQRDLKKKTSKNKAQSEKLRIKDQSLIWIAIALLLILVAVSYIVIYLLHHR